MADRVHPAREDVTATPPSAPPLSNAVTLEMPEQYIRREQQQGLLKDNDKRRHSDQTLPLYHQQQVDQVHRVPAPLPPNHPSYRSLRRRSPCCCCMISICATLATIVVLLGAAALVFYLVVKPKVPDYSVDSATVSKFNVSATTTSAGLTSTTTELYLDANVTVVVHAENPNSKIGIYYDQVDVSLFYDDLEIGSGSIPAFYQGHKNSTTLALDMIGQKIALTSSLFTSLNSTLASSTSTITLQPEVEASIRLKIGSWTSKDSTVLVTCDIVLSNPTQPNVHLISKSCSFKLKKLRIFW